MDLFDRLKISDIEANKTAKKYYIWGDLMKRFLSITLCLVLIFLNIPVIANAALDTTAPAITLSETEVKPGDTINFEIEANDTLSGLANSPDNIILIKNRVDGTQEISLHPNYNESTEKYELEYTIPSNMLKGEWYIEKVVLQDNTGNRTYYYTNITFTVDSIVIFNSNGGSEVAGLPVEYNEKAVAPSEPTKTGYTFGGWYKDNTTFANLFDFTNTSIIENIELFAKWTINNYTVTFNSQGGSAISNKSANYNSLITAPAAPTKTGYTFSGWYKEADCLNAWNFIIDKITTDKILYAKWTINNYTATFNSQGGSAVISKGADYNSVITAPAAPTKTGYTFSGWYKEAGCLNAWNFIIDKITTDKTLYAKWTSQVQRLSGINRIETSIAIAKEIYKDKAPDAVVLATANNFPDALAGSGLAYKYNAPLLLVDTTVSNSKNVLEYITTNLVKNKNIYVLGGADVVSKEISDYLTTKGYKIIRLEGKDRYATNQKIVDYMNIPKGTNVVITTGYSFADALSISSIAAMKGYPILLNGKDTLLDSVSKDITNIQPTTVYIIGGTGVLSTNIETQIKKLNGNITIVRLGGKDRYETSMKIIEYFNLTTSTISVATGIDFPDALS